VPDLVAPILAAAASAPAPAPAFDRDAIVRVARLALAAIGFAELITACQGLFGGTASGSALHSVHELGSFDMALAVGFICAAFRPALARGMLPLVVALVATLTAVTVADVVSSQAGWAGESVHLLAVSGIPMLWIAGRAASEGRVHPRPRLSATGLRAA
jgi:predicted anti-sigma-YlaC factor YlaD